MAHLFSEKLSHAAAAFVGPFVESFLPEIYLYLCVYLGDFLLVLPVKKEKKRAPQALAGGRKGTGKG